MPVKRKKSDDDSDFVVSESSEENDATTSGSSSSDAANDSSGEEEWASDDDNDDNSDAEPSPPPKKTRQTTTATVKAAAATTRPRRQSTRKISDETKARKEAKHAALQRLVNAKSSAKQKPNIHNTRSSPRRPQPAEKKTQKQINSSSSEEEEESSPSPSPVKRTQTRRRGAAAAFLGGGGGGSQRGKSRPTNLFTGYLDHKGDAGDDDVDDDLLEDFIVAEDDVEEEDSEQGTVASEDVVQNNSQDGEKINFNDEEEEELLAVPASKVQKPRGATRRGQLPAGALIESSSSSSGSDPENWVEKKKPQQAGSKALATGVETKSPVRQRLRKIKRKKISSSSPPEDADDNTTEEKKTVLQKRNAKNNNKAAKPELVIDNRQTGIRSVRKVSPTKPADLIRQAQYKFKYQDPLPNDIVDDEDVRQLTDEGEPSTTPEPSDGDNDDAYDEDDGFIQENTKTKTKKEGEDDGDVVGNAALDPQWQAAARALGIGQLPEKDLFFAYVEYLLLCYVDPSYADQVKESKEHNEYYRQAIQKIEWAITHVRDAVASEAWRSCSEGLLEAIEVLPGFETDWFEDTGEEWEQYECDACKRSKSHATRSLFFKGVPDSSQVSWADPSQNRTLSSAYEKISPVYKKRRARRHDLEGGGERRRLDPSGEMAWWEFTAPSGSQRLHTLKESQKSDDDDDEDGSDHVQPGRYERREFRVGSYCAARLILYHGLYHWKRRLLARIKQELKAELRRRKRVGEATDVQSVAEGVLAKESLMDDLYASYKEILRVGQNYQVDEGKKGGWKRHMSGIQTQVVKALVHLHDSSDCDEPSVEWPDQSDSETGQGDDDEEDEKQPQIQQRQQQPEEGVEKNLQQQQGRKSDLKRRQVLEESDTDEEDNEQQKHQDGQMNGVERPAGAPKPVDITRFFGSPSFGRNK